MSGGYCVLAEFFCGMNGELSPKTYETSVVVSGVGVVRRCHQLGITSINAVAVINKALLNRRHCRQGFKGRQWAKDLLGSRHREIG